MGKQRFDDRTGDEQKLGLRQKHKFRKGKSTVEGDPKKISIGIEAKRRVKKRGRQKVSLMRSTKKEASCLLG